jgi:hypothetical protein
MLEMFVVEEARRVRAHAWPDARDRGRRKWWRQLRRVNVINNAPGTSVETSKRWSGSIDTHEIIISAVGEGMANGRLDGPLRARLGQQVQPRGR